MNLYECLYIHCNSVHIQSLLLLYCCRHTKSMSSSSSSWSCHFFDVPFWTWSKSSLKHFDREFSFLTQVISSHSSCLSSWSTKTSRFILLITTIAIISVCSSSWQGIRDQKRNKSWLIEELHFESEIEHEKNSEKMTKPLEFLS